MGMPRPEVDRSEYPDKMFQLDPTIERASRCRKCHAQIYFFVGKRKSDGKEFKMPLSAALAVDVKCGLCKGDNQGHCAECAGRGVVTFMPSHFSDCPKAQQFRRTEQKRRERGKS